MKRLIPVFTSILLFFGGPVSARYYEASTGRFLQEDPIMLPMPVFSNSSPLLFSSQILNLYAYTENNPIDRIDPLGLWYIDVGVAAGLWGGAIGGFLIGPEGIYPYAGGGAMYLPGVSVTWSPSDPTSGWGIGAQGGFWLV